LACEEKIDATTYASSITVRWTVGDGVKTPQWLARASLGIAKREIMSGAAAEAFELSDLTANTMTEGRRAAI
jgi:hypothetical protein